MQREDVCKIQSTRGHVALPVSVWGMQSQHQKIIVHNKCVLQATDGGGKKKEENYGKGMLKVFYIPSQKEMGPCYSLSGGSTVDPPVIWFSFPVIQSQSSRQLPGSRYAPEDQSRGPKQTTTREQNAVPEGFNDGWNSQQTQSNGFCATSFIRLKRIQVWPSPNLLFPVGDCHGVQLCPPQVKALYDRLEVVYLRGVFTDKDNALRRSLLMTLSQTTTYTRKMQSLKRSNNSTRWLKHPANTKGMDWQWWSKPCPMLLRRSKHIPEP